MLDVRLISLFSCIVFDRLRDDNLQLSSMFKADKNWMSLNAVSGKWVHNGWISQRHNARDVQHQTDQPFHFIHKINESTAKEREKIDKKNRLAAWMNYFHLNCSDGIFGWQFHNCTFTSWKLFFSIHSMIPYQNKFHFKWKRDKTTNTGSLYRKLNGFPFVDRHRW